MCDFRIIQLDLRDEKIVDDIIRLQVMSYRVEAKLIDFYEIPRLFDTPAMIRTSGEIFYGCFSDDTLAGLIAVSTKKGFLDIHRMAVSPDFFRKGVASMLLRFVFDRYSDLKKITVSTGSKNEPAIRLYKKFGFFISCEMEIVKNLYITLFEKNVI